MSRVDVGTLQRLMARTWPGLEQDRLGQWELRAAGGFTGRANSALPVGDPSMGLDEALDRVQRWYRERGLAPRVQVPATLDGSPGPSDQVAELCERRGWAAEPWTLVMVRELSATGPSRSDDLGRPALDLAWAREPDDAWLDVYHYRGSQLPASARRVITAAPAWYLTARRQGELVGIGRSAVAGGVVVLAAIEVVPAQRRRGFGAVITQALADRGADEGAMLSALQVFAHNEPAVRLYRGLGYADHHRYRYQYEREGSYGSA